MLQCYGQKFVWLLGDPGCIGENMFILWRRGNIESPPDLDKGALMAYNRMHVGYRLRVEWDIGGLKRKFRRLMKQLDTTKPKYNQLF